MARSHQVAVWAGMSAFFGNIIGLKILELISGEDWLQLLGAAVVSTLVGGAAYSRERLNEAKQEEQRHDVGPSVERTIARSPEFIDRDVDPLDYDEPQVPGRGSPPRYR